MTLRKRQKVAAISKVEEEEDDIEDGGDAEADGDENDSEGESMDDGGDDDGDDRDDDEDSDEEDDYFSNADAASYWSSWSEENVHVIGLVDNDVVKRTRALKRLKMFLKTRSSDEEQAFEEKDLLKVWKGLHYCMWHSDKLLVQQELAGILADLIFCFETTASALLFIKCFYLTITREWDGIDAHRLNKFLTLIRRVWRSSLLFLKKNQWDSQLVSENLQILRETIIKPNASSPDGLTFHMIDIYIDELTKVGGFVKGGPPRSSALTQDAVFDFLRPYVVFSLKEKNRRLLHAAMRDVFDALVGQVEEDYLDDMDEDGFEMKGKIDNQKLEGPRDKGAGIDDSPGSRLPVDFSRVGGYILKLAGGKKVSGLNRKVLYKVAATFENLSKGIYPWEEIEVEENEGKKKDGFLKPEDIAKAVKRMQKENEKLDSDELGGLGGGGKRKKRRKRTMTDEDDDEKGEEEENGDDGNDDDEEGLPPPPAKKKKGKTKPEEKPAKAEKRPTKQTKGSSKVTSRNSKDNKKAKKGGLKVASQSGAWTVKA